MQENEWYTTPQAAKVIGISANHMRNLIRTGKAMPIKQIGGTWLFTLEEIERVRNRKGQIKRKPPAPRGHPSPEDSRTDDNSPV